MITLTDLIEQYDRLRKDIQVANENSDVIQKMLDNGEAEEAQRLLRQNELFLNQLSARLELLENLIKN
jgi:hypothetical protein